MQIAGAISLLPATAKPIGVVAPTVEARAVPGREGSRLIEKKQLGPALPAHYPAATAPKFQHADQPGRARPALAQQRFGRGIMDDAPVAGEHAAFRDSDDLARRQDAVLEGHVRTPLRRHSGMRAKHAGPESITTAGGYGFRA